jgi:hypothetical protein
MKNIPKPAIIAIAVIALVVVVVGAWTLVSRGFSAPEGNDEHVVAHEPLHDDPELAATSAMAGLMTWQPVQQDSPQDAAAAIADRLTGQLAEYASSDEPDPVLPEPWSQWAKAGDSVHAVATVDDTSKTISDSDSEADVDVVVDQEVWHPSGNKTPYSRFTAKITVEKVEGQWKAKEYEISDIEY